ncbi:MAG: hypothetical protein ACYDC7_11055 [Acidithiobacillus ferrivorans]|jgi:hypothetical protein
MAADKSTTLFDNVQIFVIMTKQQGEKKPIFLNGVTLLQQGSETNVRVV